VIGTSGSGKSSLVRSGLIPSLQAGYMAGASSSWRVAVMRPGEDPIGNLAYALASRDVLGGAAPDDDFAATAPVLLEATLRRGARGLADALKQARIPRDENLLVLVDQFEELFRFRRNTQIANSRDESIAFVRLLLEASRQRDQPAYVVLTMRSDFVGDCMDYPGLSEAVNEGLYLVGRMSRDALRTAITGPVAVGGGAIEPRLVHRVLNDLSDDQDQLPLVQHALMRMWEHWSKHTSAGATRSLDIHDYEVVGTFSDALSRHAEEAFEEAFESGLAPLAEQVFKSLTDTFGDARGVRRPTSVAELSEIVGAPESLVIRVVDLFRQPGRSFLMPPASVPLTARSIVDLSHESLMRCWQRLQQWAEEERASAEAYARLAQAAEWHTCGTAGLWRNPELELARKWRADALPTAAWARRYGGQFEQAIAFLDASNAESARERAEREHQRKATLRRAQWAAAVLATFLVIAISLGYLTWRERRRAEQNLDLARSAVDESLASADRDPSRAGADVPQVEEFRKELLGKAERFYRAFMNQERGSEAIRRDVATAHFRLGHINRLLEKRDDAEREYLDAVTQFAALAAERPGNPEYRATLASAHNWLGELRRSKVDRYNEANASYDSALALQQNLVRDYPDAPQYRRELARTLYNRGILRSSKPENTAASEADFTQAISLLEPIAASDSQVAQELARAYNNLGSLLAMGTSRSAEVRRWWEKAIETDERLVVQHPENREFKIELAIYCNNLAALLQEAGDETAAASRSRQAISLLDDLARPAPSLNVARADAHNLYGAILQQRDAAAAEQELTFALNAFADGARDPALRNNPDFHLRFGDYLINLAAFSASVPGAERGHALLVRGINTYATLAQSIAATGGAGDARTVLDTVDRVLPSISARDRGPLMDAQRQLQRKVGR
jgi:hypothetical protein